ncbi:PREDICTED: uncharacterized protein LOC106312165 isoform X1 [Brassica oleracea var. oleracea]|uniref:uncharacterized protein LOC106312165 isoform X1 n=1 Tax=Brassica oleracea var. oleracea TaxID=109376 RepID=UPI0006A6B8A7|nr:PREDICTED: uncharacterized protein LOC106312165 isoform X1 [Brassica oleracea var. oleracea]
MMVKAAEIDVLMSVRAFEELTYLKSMGEGLFSIQMRPNYNVMAGHPNKTSYWQRYYFFVKSDGFSFEDPPDDSFRALWNPNLGRMQSLVSDDFDFSFLITSLFCCAVDHPDTATYPEEFIASARAVASLSQDRWENITVEKIRRLSDRISKREWRSDLFPTVVGNKRWLSLFTKAEQKQINAARKMKALPDLSAILGKRLGGSSSNEPMVVFSEAIREETLAASPRSAAVPDPLDTELAEESLAPEVVEPEKVNKKGKEVGCFRSFRFISRRGLADAQSDEPPKKKTKKKKKKK